MKFIKHNFDRIILTIVLITLLAFLGQYAYKTLKTTDEIPQDTTLHEIAEYGYKLYDDDTELYATNFEVLKEVLNKETIDEDEYAKYVSLLFSIDFYTLSNKNTNMDIGGIQYVASQIKDNFILKATDTIYKNIKSNLYGDRQQELPKVSKAEVVEIKNITFKHDKINDEKAYEVTVSMDYEKDLEYPKSVVITLIHENNKLVVVEVKNTD